MMQLKNTVKKDCTKNVGLIGYSKGNGHFFSYAAIANSSFQLNNNFVENNYPNIIKYLRDNKKKIFYKKKIFNINKVFSQNKKISKIASNFADIRKIYESNYKLINDSDLIFICRHDIKKNYKDVIYSINRKKPILVDKLYAKSEKDFKRIQSMKKSIIFNSTPLVFEKKFFKLKKKKINVCKCYVKKDFIDYGNHVLEPIIYHFQIKKFKNITIKKKKIIIIFDKIKLIVLTCNKRNFEYEFFENKKLISSFKIKDYFIIFQKLLNFFRLLVSSNKKNTFEEANLLSNLIIIKNLKKFKQYN